MKRQVWFGSKWNEASEYLFLPSIAYQALDVDGIGGPAYLVQSIRFRWLRYACGVWWWRV